MLLESNRTLIKIALLLSFITIFTYYYKGYIFPVIKHATTATNNRLSLSIFGCLKEKKELNMNK